MKCKKCGEEIEKGIELEHYGDIIGREIPEKEGVMCDKCWIGFLGDKKLYHLSKDCSIIDILTILGQEFSHF